MVLCIDGSLRKSYVPHGRSCLWVLQNPRNICKVLKCIRIQWNIFLCENLSIIVKRYLLCRKYFFSLLKLYGLCEELAIRLKYDGNNRKNIGSDSTWWLLPFGVIEMMMTSAWGGCASAQGWQLQQDAINVSLKGGHSQQRIFPLQFLWKEELTWSLRKYKYVTA